PNSQIREKSAGCFSNKQDARQYGRVYYYSSVSLTGGQCIFLLYVMMCFCQCTRRPQESGMFTLHPQLAQDSIVIGEFQLSKLLLANDSQYPWFILVPQCEDVSEIFQLDQVDRQQLLNESCWLGEAL